MRPIVKNFDVTFTRLVTALPDSWQPVFLFITNLGDPIVTISIGAAVAAVGIVQSNAKLVFSGVMVWLTLLVGAVLKLLFGRARPVSEYSANLRLDTFSFPSGHSSGSMIAYGLVAYVAWHMLPQPWNYIVAVGCGVLIALIGISRVYLGAHFPSDVVAGWLLGALALLIIIFVIRPLS